MSDVGEGIVAFETAIDGYEGVLRSVGSASWGSPSPCEGWSAGDVASHVSGNLAWVVELIGPGPPGGERDRDAPGGAGLESPSEDPVLTWTAVRQAFDAKVPGALDRRVQWPFGDKTVDRGLHIFSLEFLVHTWDLAAAGGIDVELDPDLVRFHFVRLQPLAETIRGPGLYGSEQAVPLGATEQQRFLAFLGRLPPS